MKWEHLRRTAPWLAVIAAMTPIPIGAAALDAPVVTAAQIPPADSALRAGAEAEQAGDWARADAAYRRALADADQRPHAAAALRALAKRFSIGPTVDQRALSALRTLLGPDFLLTETRNFIVLSDADQAWTRQRAAILERARHQYYRVTDRLGVPVYPHEHKLVCILFNDYQRYREFSRAEDGLWAAWVAGYYSPRANRIVFYNDSSSPEFGRADASLDEAARLATDRRAQATAARRDNRTKMAAALDASATDIEQQVKRERSRLASAAAAASAAKTIHEAIHLLAFNTGLQLASRDYPFWLSEGLASSFETDDPNTGAFGPDRAASTRADGFAEARAAGRLMPLERLIGLSEVPGGPAPEPGADAEGTEQAALMYDQSTALFVHLFRYRRADLGAYIQAMAAEPPGRLGADRQRQLFIGAFGDPGSLDRKLAGY